MDALLNYRSLHCLI